MRTTAAPIEITAERNVDRRRHLLPSLAIMLVMLVAVLVDTDLRLWEKRERVIEHDIHGYYAYLPALFIYDDIRLEKSEYRIGDYYYFWPNITPEGFRLIKYPAGMAVLYAPFFFIAHSLAVPLGHEATGFTPPYKVALLAAGLFYLALGLVFTSHLLRRSGVSDLANAVTVLLLGLGTNVLAYSTQSAAMPHVPAFALVAAFMLLALNWSRRSNWSGVIFMGLLLGLMTWVRPTLAIAGLLPLLLTFRKRHEWKEEFPRIIPHFVVMGMIMILVWMPQFIYWHVVTGDHFYYTYQEEGFFWERPEIIRGSFGFRKGWLIYTPVMAFAIAGLLFMRHEALRWRTAILVVLVVHLYVTFSWWCWWYGGTFGQRSMIDIYALLAVPLAAFVQWVGTLRTFPKYAFAAVGVFLIWLNIFQTYQFENGSLHHDAMTRQLYFRQFGKYERIPEFELLLEYPDYDRALKGLDR